MDLLRELERRRELVRGQLRAKQLEFEAIEQIIDGMRRDGTAANNNGHKRRAETRDRRFAKVGLSDAIRALAADWIAPADIRNAMIRGGYKHTAKSPLLGGVFASCKRMAEDGEFESRSMDSRLEYRIKREAERPQQ